MKILLVEPHYKNKYPPLGLMKISTYHKEKGDDVTFVKGMVKELIDKKWDRVYITSLFTFYWDITLKTIEFYKYSVESQKNIYLGGVLVSLHADELSKQFEGVTIIRGLLDKPGQLGKDEIIVDQMIPDYSILNIDKEFLTYEYPTSNSFISYATRGCIRKCKFCVVHEIEPNYKNYIPLTKNINSLKEKFGDKRDLLLMDNNVLASDNFNEIIDEIKELGYEKGNKSYLSKKTNTKLTRRVDFNQGIDARLLTDYKAKKLSEIEIRPLRIAFDHANDEYVRLYTEKIRLSASYGMKYLSNYVLYNLDDSPIDLYDRLLINIDLNEEFAKSDVEKGTKIFSFPMRYSPIKGLESHGRKFVGEKWNWKYIRTIQCILNATHGVVGPNRSYFYRSFGKSHDEFELLLMMPEEYVLYRSTYEKNGLRDLWESQYKDLLKSVRKEVILELIKKSHVEKTEYIIQPEKIRSFLKHYKIKDGRKVLRDENYNYICE